MKVTSSPGTREGRQSAISSESYSLALTAAAPSAAGGSSFQPPRAGSGSPSPRSPRRRSADGF